MAQRLLLLGLEEETASKLVEAIPADKYEIHVVSGPAAAQWLGKLDTLRPSVICLPAETSAAVPLMHAVRARLARAPLVFVSRNPNPAEWKRAMDVGASDYFGPPFLAGHVDWILNSAAASLPMGSYLAARA